MAEALRKVHTCGIGLLGGLLWQVGPKLVFDEMSAPVPEIMNGSLYLRGKNVLCCILPHVTANNKVSKPLLTQPPGTAVIHSQPAG
jgi:hypothetical protein